MVSGNIRNTGLQPLRRLLPPTQDYPEETTYPLFYPRLMMHSNANILLRMRELRGRLHSAMTLYDASVLRQATPSVAGEWQLAALETNGYLEFVKRSKQPSLLQYRQSLQVKLSLCNFCLHHVEICDPISVCF